MSIFTTEFFLEQGTSILTVLGVGILFGAGLPALFALGLTSLYGGQQETGGTVAGTKNPGRVAIAYLCFGLVIALVLFGIAVIVEGKPLLQAIGVV